MRDAKRSFVAGQVRDRGASREEVTRDHGATADKMANELLVRLGPATVSIVVLIALALGWREAAVTLVVIPTTILPTMPAAQLMGSTVNRVSRSRSILLVDFIRHGARQSATLREVVLEAGAIRFKPILLTALAAMIGAATILSDPIFQGLAISLLFGLASSTLLTRPVIPAISVVMRDADRLV